MFPSWPQKCYQGSCTYLVLGSSLKVPARRKKREGKWLGMPGPGSSSGSMRIPQVNTPWDVDPMLPDLGYCPSPTTRVLSPGELKTGGEDGLNPTDSAMRVL